MGSPKILISFHILPELIERIKETLPEAEVLYEPELYGKPRYDNDQHGAPAERTPEQEKRLQSLMAQADILYGYFFKGYGDLENWWPNLKWNQSASAGIGWRVAQMGWDKSDVIFTTASGIHATPLAEFCLMSMLMFTKNYFLMAEEKERHHWQRTCATDLKTKTVGVIGLGSVGSEVARLSKRIGMRVIGSKKTVEGVDPASVHADALYPMDQLDRILEESDFLVLICPETDETRGLMGAEQFAKMKKGAVVINIARGSIIQENALIEALRSGHLGGAALDVASKEPLPSANPLWDMPRVIISPHSASTVDMENTRLTEIFCDNLVRYINGEPMRNLLDKKSLY